VIKAKWGTKRTCPKCGTRFYDLGKENPVVCIDCENQWVPEPVLKSRQPQLEEAKPVETDEDENIKDGEDEDLVIDDDDDDANPDDDMDLDDGADVPEVISKTQSGDED